MACLHTIVGFVVHEPQVETLIKPHIIFNLVRFDAKGEYIRVQD